MRSLRSKLVRFNNMMLAAQWVQSIYFEGVSVLVSLLVMACRLDIDGIISSESSTSCYSAVGTLWQ